MAITVVFRDTARNVSSFLTSAIKYFYNTATAASVVTSTTV